MLLLKVHFWWLHRVESEMAPKRGPGHPQKRATSAAVADLGSMRGEAKYKDTQSEKDWEIKRLRLRTKLDLDLIQELWKGIMIVNIKNKVKV